MSDFFVFFPRLLSAAVQLLCLDSVVCPQILYTSSVAPKFGDDAKSLFDQDPTSPVSAPQCSPLTSFPTSYPAAPVNSSFEYVQSDPARKKHSVAIFSHTGRKRHHFVSGIGRRSFIPLLRSLETLGRREMCSPLNSHGGRHQILGFPSGGHPPIALGACVVGRSCSESTLGNGKAVQKESVIANPLEDIVKPRRAVTTVAAEKQKKSTSKKAEKQKENGVKPHKHERAEEDNGEPEKKTAAVMEQSAKPRLIKPSNPKVHGKKIRVSDFIPSPPPTQYSTSKPKPIISTPGHQARQLEKIDGEICGQIEWENKQYHLRRLGRTKGWPLSQDFNSIITKVLQYDSDLFDLVSDDYELSNNLIWRGRAPELRICQTTGTLWIPKKFDQPKSGLRPMLVLPIEDFMEFVLIPHVAVRLIADDMEVSYEEALDIKDASPRSRPGQRRRRSPRESPQNSGTSVAPLKAICPSRGLANPLLSHFKRADFDSPTEDSKKSKKLRFEVGSTIRNKSTFNRRLTLKDFPPRKSKTKAKANEKTQNKKPARKELDEAAETSSRRHSTRSSTKTA
ncbi:hypothetical protein B0H19DRAFT_1063097 [Mycena capillaripes]|nr:hypothetical protein B0H19DRAFT_1063097 [Mycena capillaripes]